MKTEFLLRIWNDSWKRSLGLSAGLLLLSMANPVRGAASAELFEKGIYAEETKGEVRTAAQIYRQIVEDPSADRSLKAQAQLRLGLCQLKLGDKPEAISALDQLRQEFPDKDKLLGIVQQHMPQVLDEILKQIERNYILEVDRSELFETAIRAIIGKLDATSHQLRPDDLEFYDAKELNQLNEQIEQKLAGIGAALEIADGGVAVGTPLPGSPALAAGLRAGDRIVTIDGEALSESNLMASTVQRLRGPAGTPVTVGVTRDGSDEVHSIKIVRNTIQLPSVQGDHRKPDNHWDFMLDESKKVGYIHLTSIGKQSADEMQAALADLKARGMKALVLDLRNSPGGLLDGAVAIADLFVDQGRIVTVKGRAGETPYDAKPEGTFDGFLMVVLVNRKTASAAEIVAACLQDHQRALVIGERTTGQGIVRSIVPLKSGLGALKLPVAAYTRPSRKSVNRYPDSKDSDDWGVLPHAGFELMMTDEELKDYEKDRAARNALHSDTKTQTEFQDRPLQKALEWIETR